MTGCLFDAQAYAFPNMSVDLKLCRCNIAPKTIVRGPGFLNSALIIEHVLEHVAQRLEMDPILVREQNFLTSLTSPRSALRPSTPGLFNSITRDHSAGQMAAVRDAGPDKASAESARPSKGQRTKASHESPVRAQNGHAGRLADGAGLNSHAPEPSDRSRPTDVGDLVLLEAPAVDASSVAKAMQSNGEAPTLQVQTPKHEGSEWAANAVLKLQQSCAWIKQLSTPAMPASSIDAPGTDVSSGQTSPCQSASVPPASRMDASQRQADNAEADSAKVGCPGENVGLGGKGNGPGDTGSMRAGQRMRGAPAGRNVNRACQPPAWISPEDDEMQLGDVRTPLGT